jgi:hypothetical protein
MPDIFDAEGWFFRGFGLNRMVGFWNGQIVHVFHIFGGIPE